jgi:type IV pilus assembly protein PilV
MGLVIMIEFFKKKEGFTLVELMIALFILSIGLLATARMQLRSIGARDYAERTTTAIALAEALLESFRDQARTAAGFNSLSSGSDIVDSQGNTVASGYRRQWTITAIGNVREVTIRVSWPGGINPIVIRSLITQGG